MESQLQEFEIMCKNTKTAENLMETVNYLWEVCKETQPDFRFGSIYYNYIGWALPSEEACKIITNFWESHPNHKIVDFRAGTGLFCNVFHHLGVPKDRLLAVKLLPFSILQKVLNSGLFIETMITLLILMIYCLLHGEYVKSKALIMLIEEGNV
jgi:hypothetical protein